MTEDEIHLRYNEIEATLLKLKVLAVASNFKNAPERKVFFDAIFNIKRLFKEAECGLAKIDIVDTVPTAMRMYISRQIHPQQMEAWLTKLYLNMHNFLNFVSSKKASEQISFINEQYKLLDSITKVLNGDAYFVGCSQPSQ